MYCFCSHKFQSWIVSFSHELIYDVSCATESQISHFNGFVFSSDSERISLTQVFKNRTNLQNFVVLGQVDLYISYQERFQSWIEHWCFFPSCIVSDLIDLFFMFRMYLYGCPLPTAPKNDDFYLQPKLKVLK